MSRVSLLLCFFVLLLSFSEMDKAVYKQVAGSLEKAFGVQRKTRTMDPPKGIRSPRKIQSRSFLELPGTPNRKFSQEPL